MTHTFIPIVTPIMPRMVNIENVTTTAVLSVLTVILFIGIAVLIGWTLSKIMSSKNIKTNHAAVIGVSGVVSILLFARYGLTLTALQGLFLLFVLIYASCSDLTTHTVDDALWLLVFALSLASFESVGIGSMLLGAFCVFIPQIAMALLPPHKTLGGADIKLSTAISFLLGGWRGIGAYLIGLILAVIVMSIYNRCTNRCKKKPFALVPFLSIGAMLMFLI